MDSTLSDATSRIRINRGAKAMTGYYPFSKSPRFQPNHQMVLCHTRTLIGSGGFYPFVEMQSVYSTAPADWAVRCSVLNLFNN